MSSYCCILYTIIVNISGAVFEHSGHIKIAFNARNVILLASIGKGRIFFLFMLSLFWTAPPNLLWASWTHTTPLSTEKHMKYDGFMGAVGSVTLWLWWLRMALTIHLWPYRLYNIVLFECVLLLRASSYSKSLYRDYKLVEIYLLLNIRGIYVRKLVICKLINGCWALMERHVTKYQYWKSCPFEVSQLNFRIYYEIRLLRK